MFLFCTTDRSSGWTFYMWPGPDDREQRSSFTDTLSQLQTHTHAHSEYIFTKHTQFGRIALVYRTASDTVDLRVNASSINSISILIWP